MLYSGLKLVGAAYLVYLGFRMFTAGMPGDGATLTISEKGPKRAFWESATVEVLNPKTAIFYLAFLPQFTDPQAGLAI